MFRRKLSSRMSAQGLFSTRALLTSTSTSYSGHITATSSFSPKKYTHLLSAPVNPIQDLSKELSEQDRDTMPHILLNTLRFLNQDGLRLEHVQKWEGEFSYSHQLALIYLVRTLSMAPQNAVLELVGLNENQAFGIAKGLTRDDVYGLTYYQVDALIAFKDTPRGLTHDDVIGLSYPALETLKILKKDGLRGKHMQYWKNKHFGDSHKQTLFSLMRTYHMAPETATAELRAYPLLPLLHEKVIADISFGKKESDDLEKNGLISTGSFRL